MLFALNLVTCHQMSDF